MGVFREEKVRKQLKREKNTGFLREREKGVREEKDKTVVDKRVKKIGNGFEK